MSSDPMAIRTDDFADGDLFKDCLHFLLLQASRDVESFFPEVIEVHGLWRESTSTISAWAIFHLGDQGPSRGKSFR